MPFHHFPSLVKRVGSGSWTGQLSCTDGADRQKTRYQENRKAHGEFLSGY